MKSKTIITYIVLSVIIFAMLCGGSLKIGPLTLRNYVTVFLMLYSFLNRSYLSKNDVIGKYLIFFTVAIFCTVLNGDAFNMSFWTGTVISYFLPSFIVYYATLEFCNKNEEGGLEISNVLFVLFVINAFITILQYYSNPIGWAIARTLSSGDLQSETVLEMYGGSDNFVGIAVAAGLFGYVTGNGYFIGTYAPISSKLSFNTNKILLILGFLVMAIGAYAAFATQERMALLVVLCNVACVFFYNSHNSKSSNFLIIISVLCAVAYISNNITDYGRFSADTDNSDREQLYIAFNSFLKTDAAWLGSWSEYNSHFRGLNQHNTFMDEITRYGIVGLIPFVILFWKVARFSITHLFKARKYKLHTMYIYASATLLYLLYSMTHGTGLQSGDVMFWLLFAVLVHESNKNQQVKRTF